MVEQNKFDTKKRGKIEMRKQKGFSLIELLIVVAIILIIAAIAIPNLMRARMSANEASAVGSVRSINTAEISYNAAYSNLGFTTTLAQLGGVAGAACTPGTATGCFIDSSLSSGTKSGYTFTTGLGAAGAGTPLNDYSVTAAPTIANQTGTRYFCSFEDAVVRSSTAAITPPCAATVTALQ
jgi:prepilin-type N-terminal cleavage/methylation domain-containing protein